MSKVAKYGLIILTGENVVEFQMFDMDLLDVNYFCFNLFP